ncbi:MAG TPA: hypothetical protein VKR52_14835 [Terracidiphilus sp.]|nr:hypothetical protein [Terracidiphilus sp.]
MAVPSLSSQNAKTGNANVKGDCNITTTGSNNYIVVKGCSGLPESTRKQITEILNSQKKNQKENEEKFEELLKRFDRVSTYFQDTDQSKRLSAEYPLGYVIFDIDHTDAVFPYPVHGLEGFTFEWGTAAMMENTPDLVTIRLPDLYLESMRIAFLRNSVSWVTPPFENKAIRAYAVNSGGHTVVVNCEILSKTDKGVVFVIGIAEVRSPSH